MTKQLRRLISQVSQQGQSVCDQLEKGQADTPLAEHFREIEADIDSAPFSVVLLGLTPEARAASLAWLYGNDFSVLTVNVVKQLGLVEISLRERGYALERANGERVEFDRLDPFMEALQQSDILSPLDGEEWVDPVRLAVNTPKGLQGLKVYMPESPEMILKSPGLLNRVVSQANLLVVAAPLHYALSDADQKAIQEVSQNMDGFWPLLVVDELEENVALPNIGWWQQHNIPTVQLKPQLLTTHVTANIPNMLMDIEDDSRQALFLYLQARRVIHASQAVDERCQQELRQLGSRKNREQRKAKSGEEDVKAGGAERHQWDTLRNGINDNMSRLDKRLQEMGKRALLPNESIHTQLNQFVDRLSIDDLNQEPGHSTVKLTVKDQFLDKLKDHVKAQLKQQFKQEVAICSETLVAEQKTIEDQARNLTNQGQTLSINSLPHRDIWAALKDQLSVNVRYRGEMPKRGFMARMSDGRRAIMGISMMAMVVGATFKAVWGVDFRAVVMLMAPLIFIGVIVWSYVVWPKQDAERLNKELDRVKDGLSSELKRLLSDLQRDKQSKFAEHLDEQKKSVLRRLDGLMRETQGHQEQALKQQSGQAQQRLATIEQQMRELQTVEREINNLNRACEALDREGKSQLQQLNT